MASIRTNPYQCGIDSLTKGVAYGHSFFLRLEADRFPLQRWFVGLDWANRNGEQYISVSCFLCFIFFLRFLVRPMYRNQLHRSVDVIVQLFQQASLVECETFANNTQHGWGCYVCFTFCIVTVQRSKNICPLPRVWVGNGGEKIRFSFKCCFVVLHVRRNLFTHSQPSD